MVALEKIIVCFSTFYGVAVKITVDIVKCTGTHCNFSSATMNYPNVTTDFCLRSEIRICFIDENLEKSFYKKR